MNLIVGILTSLVASLTKLLEKVIEDVYTGIKPRPVCYRDALIIRHFATKYSLHSHHHCYTHYGTSGQQEVTAWGALDENDYWIVKGPYGQPEEYKNALPVYHGDLIRFEHFATQRNLHSHYGHPSPVSGQQEVTAFQCGADGNIDDIWRVELSRPGIWYRNQRVRFIHVATNSALHSHHGFVVREQQEVTCFPDRNSDDWWFVDP